MYNLVAVARISTSEIDGENNRDSTTGDVDDVARISKIEIYPNNELTKNVVTQDDGTGEDVLQMVQDCLDSGGFENHRLVYYATSK